MHLQKKIIGNVTNLLGTIVTTLMPASPYDIIPLLQKILQGQESIAAEFNEFMCVQDGDDFTWHFVTKVGRNFLMFFLALPLGGERAIAESYG